MQVERPLVRVRVNPLCNRISKAIGNSCQVSKNFGRPMRLLSFNRQGSIAVMKQRCQVEKEVTASTSSASSTRSGETAREFANNGKVVTLRGCSTIHPIRKFFSQFPPLFRFSAQDLCYALRFRSRIKTAFEDVERAVKWISARGDG